MTYNKFCSVEGCTGKVQARDLCWKHYARWRRSPTGDISDPVGINEGVCSVEGCENQARAHGMCQKHYMRVERHGDPTKVLNRKPPVPERITYNAEQCIVHGCKSELYAKELCYNHYKNFMYHLKEKNVRDVFDYLRLREDNE